MTSETRTPDRSTDAATTDTLPLRPGRWLPDPMHSSVGFTVRHLGISKVQGHFAEFETELVVGETFADSAVTATVALASIETGNATRDEHVRAEGLLDVERRKTMTFRSTRLDGAGEDWTLEGELTIGGVTRPVTFAVEFGGLAQFGPEGDRHAGFEASGQIRRSDFGIGFGAGEAVIGDSIKIQLDLQFIEPA